MPLARFPNHSGVVTAQTNSIDPRGIPATFPAFSREFPAESAGLSPYPHSRADLWAYVTLQPPPLAYFVKLRSTCSGVLPLLKDVFPSSTCLFMYRDVVAVAKSARRLSMATPFLHLVSLLGSVSGQMTKAVASWADMNGAVFCVRLDNDLTFGALFYVEATSAYLEVFLNFIIINTENCSFSTMLTATDETPHKSLKR